MNLQGRDFLTLKDYTAEEIAYLLLMGDLPTKDQLDRFISVLDSQRELPDGFTASSIMRATPHDIMNALARSVLLLYSYDEHAEDRDIVHEIDTAISLISRLPRIMVLAYYAMRAQFHNESMIMHRFIPGQSTAETILQVLRGGMAFNRDEAMLLDVMLMLHAEHGGGNNSTFACRVLSSSATDPYSAYAAAIGSLKGPRHGGANAKVVSMHEDIRAHVSNWENEDEVAAYLGKILDKQAFDGTGLIYGMGHAVYTLSDPRAEVCRRYARTLAAKKDLGEEFALIERIERLAPQVMRDHGMTKPICANIDLYTGFIYKMLGVPETLFTPLFAVARMAGWSAHRMEELFCAHRIIRPAYRPVIEPLAYKPLADR